MYKKFYKGRVKVVKLCKEWDATSFCEAMYHASDNGHIEIVKLHKECSTTDFNAAWNG